MRFTYSDRSTRLSCSSGLTTICVIAKQTSACYVGMLYDHPLMSATESIDDSEVEVDIDMLRIITSLVLL